MRIRLSPQLLALLLATSFSSCSKEDAVTAKQLAGEWDHAYYKETSYDANGKIIYQSTIPGGWSGESQSFTKDKQYKHYLSFRVQDEGTYTLKGKTLTVTITKGAYPGTRQARIVTLTETELVEEFDFRKGKEGLVSVLYAKRR